MTGDVCDKMFQHKASEQYYELAACVNINVAVSKKRYFRYVNLLSIVTCVNFSEFLFTKQHNTLTNSYLEATVFTEQPLTVDEEDPEINRGRSRQNSDKDVCDVNLPCRRNVDGFLLKV